MPKWLKFLLALLLLPVCAGAAKALWLVLNHSGEATTIWVGFFAGAACWIVIYSLLPKPMWVYVVGHELTHAIWAWLFGAELKAFKATSKGGHVIVTKSNFLIALAPYFFPLYAVIIVAIYAAAQLLWNWSPYVVWFHLLLGAAYAFHITLTWHVLKVEQSDITQQGYLFSAVVIFLGNMALLLVGVPLLTSKVTVPAAFIWWRDATLDVLRALAHLF